MKNLFIILCCFVFGMIIAKHTNADKVIIPRINNDIPSEHIVKDVVSTFSKKLKNKSYNGWWEKGADSLGKLYSGEELILHISMYVHDNIEYKNDTNIINYTFDKINSEYTIKTSIDVSKNIEYNISKHKGVCVDYSICFMLMCKYLKIKVNCIEIPNHMLNIVNVNGNRIYIDPTDNKIYYSFDELKAHVIDERKDITPTYHGAYGRITYPEKFNYHVYKETRDGIYSSRVYKLYDSFGGCYNKDVIDVVVYKK